MYIFATEDKTEFEHAFKGLDYLLALWDMDQWLRSQVKYQGREEFQEVREQLHEILHDSNIDLDRLR